jgi:hypothetical protein
MLNCASPKSTLRHVPEMEKLSGPVESLHAAACATSMIRKNRNRLRIYLASPRRSL